jgi:hypothetical protein
MEEKRERASGREAGWEERKWRMASRSWDSAADSGDGGDGGGVSHGDGDQEHTGTVASRTEMAAWCRGTGTTGRTLVGIKP